MSTADERIRTALGFAMKAGKLKVGEFAAERALRSGKAKLLAVDSDSSDNTKKQWTDACAYHGVPLITITDLGSAVGKAGRMCAAVTDGNFTNMILKAHESACPTEGTGKSDAATEAMINE